MWINSLGNISVVIITAQIWRIKSGQTGKVDICSFFALSILAPLRAKTHFSLCLLISLLLCIIYPCKYIIELCSSIIYPAKHLVILFYMKDGVYTKCYHIAFILQWISNTERWITVTVLHTNMEGTVQVLTSLYNMAIRSYRNYFVCHYGKHQNIRDS